MSHEAHSKNCILAEPCTLANTAKCNARCSSYIATMGYNGLGGRVGAANVPAEYRRVTLANSPARTEQAAAYKHAETYAHTFTRQFGDASDERIKSLYLYSAEPGTGKTTTAAALLNEYIVRHYIGSIQRGLQPQERPGYFLDANEAQVLYTEFNRPKVPDDIAEPASREYYRRLQAAKLTPFVIIDDIGVRDATDGFRGDLHSVINHRVTNAMPTVYTSNVLMDDLATVFDRRLADRIRDMCIEIRFVGESKRGLRKTA
ncbi:DNA replication protein [Paenibacillus sp. FSL K6-2859]|uniref:DNA replication protein n=1 Tax=Paenibacillus sp. FSL K6-2859 TaxID=2921482 RepID=UPI0030F60025